MCPTEKQVKQLLIPRASGVSSRHPARPVMNPEEGACNGNFDLGYYPVSVTSKLRIMCVVRDKGAPSSGGCVSTISSRGDSGNWLSRVEGSWCDVGREQFLSYKCIDDGATS